ncbi:hypothetical protein NTHiID18_00450 [Haemophilus influenzae]|nr:hypothetical protein BV083_1757 [Haemophilus influenzae]AVI98560.1 hypothetical protein BV085_1755 [Haemophilus influenzae]AVJ03689.1 hypothetical protein BV131_1404 [Haemophilus influenzae]AVJ05745.1 hypothetical protein BV134_1723 [Haemophilus influenzae]AVJ07579.1 hypothetical protein BV139_1814 [Haemophilus influenzae]
MDKDVLGFNRCFFGIALHIKKILSLRVNWDEVVFEVNFKHNKKTSEFLAALSKVSANLHK